jgi:mRNA interferase MazF
MLRGEVWQVDLDPVRGSEGNKQRPAVIVSNDRANAPRHALAVVWSRSCHDQQYPQGLSVSGVVGGDDKWSRCRFEGTGRAGEINCDTAPVRRMGRISAAELAHLDDALQTPSGALAALQLLFQVGLGAIGASTAVRRPAIRARACCRGTGR